MNVVLDTNVLVQIIFPGTYGYSVWKKYLDGEISLCYTTSILLEYEEIIARFTGDSEFARSIVMLILNEKKNKEITVSFKFNLIEQDPDDNKFVDCAIASGAKYIVSDDKHFNVLNHIGFPKVDCISLRQFKQLLDKKKTSDRK